MMLRPTHPRVIVSVVVAILADLCLVLRVAALLAMLTWGHVAAARTLTGASEALAVPLCSFISSHVCA
jgi:hypothetical protein